MRIFGYTTYSDHIVDRFEKAASKDPNSRLALLFNKMKLCDYELLLVSPHPLISEKLKDGWDDPQKLIKLHTAWQNIMKQDVEDKEIVARELATIYKIGEPLSPNFPTNSNALIKRFREDPSGKRFFVLLDGTEPNGLPVNNLYHLCNLWQLENDFSLIHSAGIIHKERLFLFCGPHGAGKSTIARLSEEMGDSVLDDDMVLIPSFPAKDFSTRAWGYSLRRSSAPLCAIIKIVKDDDKESFVAKDKTQMAHFLMERSIEVFGDILNDRMMEKLFRQIALLARNVPGYEMHFRKSLDFWKLIDEQIPT